MDLVECGEPTSESVCVCSGVNMHVNVCIRKCGFLNL
jgi:hypothetical protein